MTDPIPVARVNNRLPMLAVGLSWDSGFDSDDKLNSALLTQHHDGAVLDTAARNPFFVYPEKGATVDLQLILVACDQAGQPIAVVDGDEVDAFDSALTHTGDDQTGAEGGWDELANINLAVLSPEVQSIALFAHCRSGHAMAEAGNTKMELFYMRDMQPLLSGATAAKGKTHFFALLKRDGEDFVLQPVQAGVTVAALGEVSQLLKSLA